MDSYTYSDTPQTRPTGNYGALPEGDYDFTIIYNEHSESDKPVLNANGNWVLNLKLSVGPQQRHIFYKPWSGILSSGANKGEYRDNIAELLRGVGCAPAGGKEPDWSKLVGAKGKVHLKVETEQYAQSKMFGQEVNRVAYILRPRDTRTATQSPTYTPQQVRESATAVRKAAHDPDLDVEPEDVPF